MGLHEAFHISSVENILKWSGSFKKEIKNSWGIFLGFKKIFTPLKHCDVLKNSILTGTSENQFTMNFKPLTINIKRDKI
jgi:hypothetical protein